ncbi:peptidase S28 [Lindgomyces ingoldianus]|uniref:Peptidase S28 n=1 Tax=Lindgomyces ingoldianus TaxID=673940 RepID=A0ACB6QE88_9PLEO|nr:peptidase S28 [Lindgomyces ingoldianus]KAF2465344.1 peptidase S28 [Lindgomyces ingoldianus]
MYFPVAFGLFFWLQATAALLNGRKPVYQLRREAEQRNAARTLAKRDVNPESLYPAYNISVPVDFFHNETRYEPHSNDTFNLRYWFDASHYKQGGPVFVLLGGETDGADRLPFLQKGIVAQVTQATGGLGVILEHRYYGTSFPVHDLSVENMRFLSTEQALAEIDYFARNVEFEGIDHDMTAPRTPWIVYGGSYAGAQAAFLRVVYPETFFGAISSSGVTKAIYDYWEYFEPIRQFAPPDCVKGTQLVVDVVDKILMGNNTDKIAELKAAFGLGRVSNNKDFVNVLTNGIYGWQSTNWDPDTNWPGFFEYCTNMTTTLLDDSYQSLRPTVQDLLLTAGYKNDTGLENIMLNAIGYFGVNFVSVCKSEDQNECFTLNNATYYQQDDISQYAWRSWDYQVCTEWGYIQTGNTPPDIMPLVSRLLDIPYLTAFCVDAFNISTPSDVSKVNKYGAFDIEYPRLAIIGGNADPWRPATPLADAAKKRTSTTEKPVLEIAHGVHHWEENGIFPNQTTPILPPYQIVYAQEFVKNFVVEWLKDWGSEHYEL